VLRVDNGQLTTIGSLLTNETYTIAVAAFTDIGEGPPSEPMHAIILGRLMPPANVKVGRKPAT